MTENDLHNVPEFEQEEEAVQKEFEELDGLFKHGRMKGNPSVEQKEETDVIEEADSFNNENEEALKAPQDAEEPSDFLLQWQKRHEEYLENQHRNDEEAVLEKKKKEPSSSKISKRKKRPKMDEVASGNEEPNTEAKKQEQKKSLSSQTVWRMVLLYCISITFLIISVYFISPYGHKKNIKIEGNQHLSTENILKNSLIHKDDYVLTTFLNANGHERNIKQSSPWVKSAKISFQFPNRFTILVSEYEQIGFVKQGEEYFSALSSGNISETSITANQLPPNPTIIQLKDRKLIKELIEQLAKIDPKITSEIETIQLTPSKASNDLLTLNMRTGHKVLVPLSEIDIKLPYYNKIAMQLDIASTIDMEVGIFSYANQ